MSDQINRLFWMIFSFVARFRYRVQVSGGERLKNLRGPILILPNHPAYIDPPLLTSHLRLHRPLRPLVFSDTYRFLPLRPMVWIMKAIEVPNLSIHSQEARDKGWALIDEIVHLINAGECLLLYPSGRIQRGNQEFVGAARSAYELVSKCPNLTIVLVRTRGVWGSSFSCAETGTLPNLSIALGRGFFWCSASLLLFMPKRKITVDVHVTRPRELPLTDRQTFNTYLEQWYNSDGGEEPSFVRYHRWFGPAKGKFNRALSNSPLKKS